MRQQELQQVKNKSEEQRNMRLQDLQQQGVERIKNVSEEQRNMRPKDVPQHEQRNMRLEDRQPALQAIARKQVWERFKSEVKN